MSEVIIGRPEYLEQLKQWHGQTDLVKIVTGVRRCGKSKLFSLYQTDLMMHDKVLPQQIININLEDLMQTRKIGLELDKENFYINGEKLLDYVIANLIKGKMTYVFLDEIQLLRNWQPIVNTLRLQENVDVYLTGSNAYMFSSDLANSFGGRYIEIKMQPFSLKEYYSAYQSKAPLFETTIQNFEELRSLGAIYSHYIKESGFPQTVNLIYNRQLISDYLLNTVYQNTIQKDIVKRFNIADSSKLDAVVKYLFDNIGNETSVNSITKSLKASGANISAPTITTYIQGLLDSYLLYKCEKYDMKGKRILEGNAKYYVIDLGLRTAVLGQDDRDLGHILENVVFLELIRRGYKVSTGKVATKSVQKDGQTERKEIEVDFVAEKSGGNKEYYQVAYTIAEPETLNRELASLEEIDDHYPKYLLTMDYGRGDNNGIKRINVLDWLMDFE